VAAVCAILCLVKSVALLSGTLRCAASSEDGAEERCPGGRLESGLRRIHQHWVFSGEFRSWYLVRTLKDLLGCRGTQCKLRAGLLTLDSLCAGLHLAVKSGSITCLYPDTKPHIPPQGEAHKWAYPVRWVGRMLIVL
jgi:hypothetical protein